MPAWRSSRTAPIAVYVGSSAIGQGIETIMAQIAADALDLPLSRIKVLHASTTYLREGFGSYGSRATVMGGSAVIDAANNLLEALRAARGSLFRCAAEQAPARRRPRRRSRDGRTVDLGGDSRREALSVEGVFASTKPTYSYGTAAAHVAVDPRTGHVALIDYLVVDDVGRIVNPLTLHGQVIGAAVQGCGSVFGEHLVYDAQGQLLVATLADYLVPLATDFPNLRAISSRIIPRRITRSAPRARAKAASSRSGAPSPTRSRPRSALRRGAARTAAVATSRCGSLLRAPTRVLAPRWRAGSLC